MAFGVKNSSGSAKKGLVRFQGIESGVTDLERDDLSLRCQTIQVWVSGMVRSDDASYVCTVRSRDADYAQNVAVFVEIARVGKKVLTTKVLKVAFDLEVGHGSDCSHVDDCGLLLGIFKRNAEFFARFALGTGQDSSPGLTVVEGYGFYERAKVVEVGLDVLDGFDAIIVVLLLTPISCLVLLAGIVVRLGVLGHELVPLGNSVGESLGMRTIEMFFTFSFATANEIFRPK